MRWLPLALVFALTARSATALAEPAGKTIEATRQKLDNGLRVVLIVDHTAPTIAIDIVYDVGSRDEKRGRSGFAHLVEHMMVSADVARGEYAELGSGHGDKRKGTTSEDRTHYFQSVPSSGLALGLWVEADRMKSLDVSRASFENERSVVKEELRMRLDNAAYAPAATRLQELVYEGYWPYERSALGSMRDLDAAPLEEVRSFHEDHYAPNDAVLALAGDFEEADAMVLVKRYFGDARRRERAPVVVPAFPEPTGPRSVTVEDTHAKLGAVLIGFAIPPRDKDDHYALELAAALLGDGESARIRRVLVREKGLASSVSATVAGFRGPDFLSITARLATGARPLAVERAVELELEELARLGPTDEELKKLANRMRVRSLLGLQSNRDRAERFAEMELDRGDARLVNGELDRYLAVTKEDIKRVTATFLLPRRRRLVEVKPGLSSPAQLPAAGNAGSAATK